MATAVWDSGSWSVSNGGLTATSPNTGQGTPSGGGAINEEFASTPIPVGAKVYYEFKVSGAAVFTAFSAGFGELGSNAGGYDPSHVVNSNNVPNGAAEAVFGYNLGITEGKSIVYDPQGNVADSNAGRAPAPNRWANGATIGVEVDRVNQTAQFFLDGQSMGGPISIKAMGNETLYPMVESWFKAGPQATLIGNPTDVPAGYTALDSVGQNNHPAPSPAPAPKPAPAPVTTTEPPPSKTPPAPSPSKETTPAPTPSPSTSDTVPASTISQHIAPPATPGFVNPDTAGVTVDKPNVLPTGQVVLTGHETGMLTQTVFLDWHTFGVPAYNAGDWVAANVNQTTGDFSVTLNVDHAGVASTLFAHAGHHGAVEALWSATPA